MAAGDFAPMMDVTDVVKPKRRVTRPTVAKPKPAARASQSKPKKPARKYRGMR